MRTPRGRSLVSSLVQGNKLLLTLLETNVPRSSHATCSLTQQIHTLLNCIITGGLVLDTSLESIHATFKAQQDVKKASQNGGGLSVSGLKDVAGGFLSGGDWDRLSFAGLTRRGR